MNITQLLKNDLQSLQLFFCQWNKKQITKYEILYYYKNGFKQCFLDFKINTKSC